MADEQAKTETVTVPQEEAPAGLDERSFRQKVNERLKAPDAVALMLANRHRFENHQQLTAFWKKVEEHSKSTNYRLNGIDGEGKARFDNVPVTEHQAVLAALGDLS